MFIFIELSDSQIPNKAPINSMMLDNYILTKYKNPKGFFPLNQVFGMCSERYVFYINGKILLANGGKSKTIEKDGTQLNFLMSHF